MTRAGWLALGFWFAAILLCTGLWLALGFWLLGLGDVPGELQ